jgi:hypothetical protein
VVALPGKGKGKGTNPGRAPVTGTLPGKQDQCYRSASIQTKAAGRVLTGRTMQLDVLFASAVVVLAGLAVLGVSSLVIVWEWRAIRHTLHAYRQQPTHQERVPGDRVSVLPARRP